MSRFKKFFQDIFNLHETVIVKSGEFAYISPTNYSHTIQVANLGNSDITLLFIDGNCQIIAQLDSKYTIKRHF